MTYTIAAGVTLGFLVLLWLLGLVFERKIDAFLAKLEPRVRKLGEVTLTVKAETVQAEAALARMRERVEELAKQYEALPDEAKALLTVTSAETEGEDA